MNPLAVGEGWLESARKAFVNAEEGQIAHRPGVEVADRRLQNAVSRWLAFLATPFGWNSNAICPTSLLGEERGQERGEGRVDDQHRADHRMKSSRAGEVAVVGPPENLSRALTRSTDVRPL